MTKVSDKVEIFLLSGLRDLTEHKKTTKYLRLLVLIAAHGRPRQTQTREEKTLRQPE